MERMVPQMKKKRMKISTRISMWGEEELTIEGEEVEAKVEATKVMVEEVTTTITTTIEADGGDIEKTARRYNLNLGR